MNSAASPGGLPSGVFASVFEAIGGLRNLRALAALLGCLVVGILVAVLASFLGTVGVLLGALILYIAAGTGVNAAGALLMDQARGRPLRGLVDALVYGLMCIPKLIVLGLALLAVAIVVFIALALLLLVCKIPGLGPVLYVVVFPLSVVVAGVTLFGLFVCLVLALPAIWEGATVMRAISQALAIARARLVEALLLLAAVWLLCLFVGFIVFGILGSGLMPTIGLSAKILGGGVMGMMGMMQGFGGGYGGYGGGYGGGGGGYAIAAMIGGSVLWALAATLVAQVYLLGLNLVYLRITEGLDTSSMEGALMRGLDDAKRRAAELGEKAKAAANRERDAAASVSTVPPPYVPPPAPYPAPPTAPYQPPAPPPPPATGFAPPAYSAAPAGPVPGTPLGAALGAQPLACPNCAAPCTTDDLFCGVCGQRLK